MAKTILEKNSSVFLPDGSEFFYDECDVEKRRDGKQPDIFLTNSATGKHLVVEIFYSHRMERETLAVFREKRLRVMEIDKSSIRKTIPSMQEFERLVLRDAPRKFLYVPEEEAAPALVYKWKPASPQASPSWAQRVSDWWEENWVLVAILIVGVFVGYRVNRFFYPKRR